MKTRNTLAVLALSFGLIMCSSTVADASILSMGKRLKEAVLSVFSVDQAASKAVGHARQLPPAKTAPAPVPRPRQYGESLPEKIAKYPSAIVATGAATSLVVSPEIMGKPLDTLAETPTAIVKTGIQVMSDSNVGGIPVFAIVFTMLGSLALFLRYKLKLHKAQAAQRDAKLS